MLGDTQSSYSEDLLRGFYTCAREEDINIIFLMGPQMPQYCKDILSCSFDGDYNYQFDTIYDYVHFTRPDAHNHKSYQTDNYLWFSFYF